MRKLISSLAAIAILAVTYTVSFGVPTPLASVFPMLTDASEGAVDTPNNVSRNSSRPRSATTVVLQELERSPYTSTIETIGTASSWRSADITAESSGRVVELALSENGSVGSGDILVRLDDRSEKLGLDVARAEQQQAQSVVNRFNTLRTSGNSSVTDAVMAEADLALTQARIAVDLAEVALDERVITSPISGKLGLSDVELGDLITESQVIVTVDDTEQLLIEFEIPERAVSLLALGRTVLASTPTYAGRVFDATVTAFDSRIDSTTRSISVQAKVDNTDGLLWSGMTFAVRVIDTSEPLAMVPSTALNWARHGAGIWVVDDGKASRQPVTVRFRRGGNAWLDTDVPDGANVVVEGALKLREGSTVEAVPAALTDDTPLQGVFLNDTESRAIARSVQTDKTVAATEVL